MEKHPTLVTERLNTIKTPTLSKAFTTDSTQSPSKFQWLFFFPCRNKKQYPKIHTESQRSMIVQTILRKTKVEALYFLISKPTTKIQ